MRKLNAKKLLVLAAFPLLLAAVIVPVIIWHDALWRLFTSPQRLRDWVAAWGIWAPAIFIALQTLQVIVFAIPGEVAQIAGGYLFGTWQGSLLSVAGILIGSVVSFFLARTLGRPFVAALIPAPQVEKIENLLSSRSARVVFFLLFLIPGIPKDILCYVAGLTTMGFLFFVGASTLGRLPGIVGSAIIGNAAASSEWVLAAVVGAAAAALFAAGFFLRPKIQVWLEWLARKSDPPTGS